MLVCEAIDFGRTLNTNAYTKTKYNLTTEKNGTAMLESGSVVNIISADGAKRRVIVGATQKVKTMQVYTETAVY